MTNDARSNWVRQYLAPILVVAGAIIGYTRLQDKVEQQSDKIEDLEGRVDKLKEWQDTWPRTGQLAEDVNQNSELKFHKECIERLRARVEKLEEKQGRRKNE